MSETSELPLRSSLNAPSGVGGFLTSNMIDALFEVVEY